MDEIIRLSKKIIELNCEMGDLESISQAVLDLEKAINEYESGQKSE